MSNKKQCCDSFKTVVFMLAIPHWAASDKCFVEAAENRSLFSIRFERLIFNHNLNSFASMWGSLQLLRGESVRHIRHLPLSRCKLVCWRWSRFEES